MNKKIIISTVLIVLTCAMLAGCQLAVDGADSERSNDKLVGAFITDDHVDLFNTDEFIENNSNELIKGEANLDISGYQGKVYGTISENNPYAVEFEGYDGVLFMDTVKEHDGQVYHSFETNNLIGNLNTFVSIDDINGNGMSIKGTVYIGRSTEYIVINPIYKTPEGEYYFVPGSPLFMDQFGSSSITKSISEDYTENTGGTEVTESFEVNVQVEYIEEAEYYVLKQMDKDDNVVSTTKIHKDNIPESIKLSDGVQYTIVEKVIADGGNNIVYSRQIVNNESYFTIHFFNDSIFAEWFRIQLD